MNVYFHRETKIRLNLGEIMGYFDGNNTLFKVMLNNDFKSTRTAFLRDLYISLWSAVHLLLSIFEHDCTLLLFRFP